MQDWKPERTRTGKWQLGLTLSRSQHLVKQASRSRCLRDTGFDRDSSWVWLEIASYRRAVKGRSLCLSQRKARVIWYTGRRVACNFWILTILAWRYVFLKIVSNVKEARSQTPMPLSTGLRNHVWPKDCLNSWQVSLEMCLLTISCRHHYLSFICARWRLLWTILRSPLRLSIIHVRSFRRRSTSFNI